MSASYIRSMNRLKRFTIVGIIFVLIWGSISHFVYEWSGDNLFVGFFFPINESVWEHMKLCFFPMLLYSFYMNRKLKSDYPCITSALLFGILLSTFLIPILFYTYSGILGRNYTFLDISTFVVSVLVSFFVIYKLTLSCKMEPYTALLKSAILAMTVCFILFTYLPPDLGIFAPQARQENAVHSVTTLQTSTQLSKPEYSSNSSKDSSMALLELPHAGNTVSKRFSDTSR